MGIDQIQARTECLRAELIEHPIYAEVRSLEQLRVFMESHVFAVWDFMTLLKSLQSRVCGVGRYWLPPRDAAAARLVNEIVLAEESDEDGRGGYASHYELYRQAMAECGASDASICQFVDSIANGQASDIALSLSGAPSFVKDFCTTTLDVAENASDGAVAAAFAFGREEVIPDLFRRLVDELNSAASGRLSRFVYYLDRHIELDEGEHGPMAMQLVATLCGRDPAHWRQAEDAAVRSLVARKQLWDGLHRQMHAVAQASAMR